MKVEKNKIIFSIVLVCILLFIGSYAMLVLGEDEEPTLENNQVVSYTHLTLPTIYSV